MTYFAFSRALHLMKYSGAKVRRAGWENETYHIYIDENFYNKSELGTSEIVAEAYENKYPLPYQIDTDDVLANDWEIYE